MEDINRTRILTAAKQLFNTRGYRSVTVQDLALELGMSKKTIYLYFNGKEEIAAEVVEGTIKEIARIAEKNELEQTNPLIALKEILLNVQAGKLRFGPLFLMDLQKYLPELYQKYNQFREKGKGIIGRLLKKAQEMGMLKDIPITVAMEILHECLHALAKPEFLSQNNHSVKFVVDTFLDIFISGLAVSQTNNEA